MLKNNRGFAHLGALVVAFLVLFFIGYFAKQQVAIYNERKTYREAEAQITQLIDAAAKLASSTKETRKYCSYSSAKYSKGSLGCEIRGSVEYGVIGKNVVVLGLPFLCTGTSPRAFSDALSTCLYGS
jgi:hypothetical protein